MKKKVLLLSIVMSILFVGVVSAASIWGTYKGKSIIRLTVDNVPVKVTDAPAVSMDGRTMIPIYLLQQAGINYTWDQANKTVDIKSSISESSASNLSSIKLLAKITNTYDKFGTVGNSLWETGDRILDANSSNSSTSTQHASDSLNNSISLHNQLLSDIKNVVTEAVFNNLNVDSVVEIAEYYSSGIENYKNAINSLSIGENDASIEYLKKADSYIDSGRTLSQQEESYFYNKILNSN